VWWIAIDNFYRCFNALHQRHEELTAIHAIRVACEARGGFYGATKGRPEQCFGRDRRGSSRADVPSTNETTAR